MKAIAVPVIALFRENVRYEVPLFQRQYVWSRRKQWEPFWDDIQRKFRDHLHGRTSAPVHFLGALVLDHQPTPAAHVGRRQVVDGQQRLTTLQIFFAAWRDYCRQQAVSALANQMEGLIFNTGLMVDPHADRFKVWPTLLDRPQYVDVITIGSVDKLELRYPEVRSRVAGKLGSSLRIVQAYRFFAERLVEFFSGTSSEAAPYLHKPLEERLNTCFQALTDALRAVVIDLEEEDDAQVIFETLNARGEPLLPADLVRNFIFLRAAKHGENVEALHGKYWQSFDEPFWREPVQQGRLLRPRSDLFMQCLLTSQRGEDVSATHLFTEYKDWLAGRTEPFPSVEAELKVLLQHGTNFRRLVTPDSTDKLFPLVEFLDAFEARTTYPLLLTFLELSPKADWKKITDILESYLLHRAVCGLSTKNYNQIFAKIVKALRREGANQTTLRRLLLELNGDSSRWPRQAEFSQAWLNQPVYRLLDSARLVYIFKRLNAQMLTAKHESLSLGSLSIEHIMPQHWRKHWLLPNGEKALPTSTENVLEEDPTAQAAQRRDAAVNTLGNLTIITQALNSSVSDGPWTTKQAGLLEFSLLPINRQLHDYEHWDEATIRERGKNLLARALRIWPQP